MDVLIRDEGLENWRCSKPIIVNAITFQTRNLVCVERSPLKVRSPQFLFQHREVRGSWTSGQDLLGVKLPAEEKRAGSLSTFTSYGAGK